MSTILQEVTVIATTASGTIDMFVEVSVADAFHEALPLGSAVSGQTLLATMNSPMTSRTLTSITPADIVLQVAYDVGGAVWVPASLYVIGRGADGSSRLLAAIPQWPAAIGLTELGEDGRTAVSSGNNYFAVTAQSLLSAS